MTADADRDIKPEKIVLDQWTVLLMVLGALATCAITNATEDAALAACYEAGFSPEECDR